MFCVALRCVALRCVALRCVALRCVALRCTVLCCCLSSGLPAASLCHPSVWMESIRLVVRRPGRASVLSSQSVQSASRFRCAAVRALRCSSSLLVAQNFKLQTSNCKLRTSIKLFNCCTAHSATAQRRRQTTTTTTTTNDDDERRTTTTTFFVHNSDFKSANYSI